MNSDNDRGLSVPDHIVWKELGGEMILLDLQSGEYLTLSETAAFIYVRVARGDTKEVVHADLVQAFEGDESEMSQAISDFLDEMVGIGYLVSGEVAGG